jgi:hypothetical protein
MNDFVSLTYTDLANIIIASNQVGKKGNFVKKLIIIKPTSVAQNINSSIIVEEDCIKSTTESEPAPIILIGQ